MKRGVDRNNDRRDYIRKKRRAQTKVVLGSTFGVLTGSTCIWSGCWLCFALYAEPILNALPFKNPDAPPFWLLNAVLFLVTLTCAILAWHGGKISKRGIAEAKNLTVVPPLTVDTLPDNEILVRGSKEPPIVQRKVLLRVAAKGQVTATEELLRITDDAG